jgi:small subunit ribosomal protein S3
MTHRVHQRVLRIKEMKDWDTRGFYEKNAAKYLEEDLRIRNLLEEKLKLAGIAKIEIERFQAKIHIIISTGKPGLIIGRGGEGVEKLEKELKKLLFEPKELRLEIQTIRDPWSSAALTGQWIAQQLEKRARFKKTIKEALSKAMSSRGTQGVKIQVSGRLDGVEMARREWLKEGRLPRQTLRSDMDYVETRALCASSGIVGIKVWIYKGEKL